MSDSRTPAGGANRPLGPGISRGLEGEKVTTKTAAPSDKACAEAWGQIMAIAREHALIVSAYGGVATLAIPREQRTAGIRDRVLRAHLLAETTEGGGVMATTETTPKAAHTPGPPNYADLGLAVGFPTADRLLACWNACEGINPEAVPELLAVCEEFDLERLGMVDARLAEMVRAALAKARGA